MKKTIPTFVTDQEAEDFVATADLADYDLSDGQIVRFELRLKDKTADLRLPEASLDTVRQVRSADGTERLHRLTLPFPARPR